MGNTITAHYVHPTGTLKELFENAVIEIRKTALGSPYHVLKFYMNGAEVTIFPEIYEPLERVEIVVRPEEVKE